MISADAIVSAGACPGVLINVVTNQFTMIPLHSRCGLNNGCRDRRLRELFQCRTARPIFPRCILDSRIVNEFFTPARCGYVKQWHSLLCGRACVVVGHNE